LAAYLSAAPRSPGPEYAGGHDLSAGKRLYQAACRDCHGPNGEGTKAGIPAIGGQQFRYLAVQLENFTQGHRDAENRAALVAMGSLSPQDIRDVANYASHLSYLTSDSPP
jgi:cytochrome c553